MIARVLNPVCLLACFFILFAQFSKGQDIIVKKSGARFYAKVLSVDESIIKYIEYNKQMYDFREPLKTSDVLLIRYGNGEVKVFDKSNANVYALGFLNYYSDKSFKEEVDTLNHFQNLKEGAYFTLGKFMANSPAMSPSKYKISKRSKADIAFAGGNDYDIEIGSEVWGVFQDGSLYIHGKNLTESSHYCKAEILGKYCYLRPAFPTSPDLRVQIGLPRKIPSNNNPALSAFSMFGVLGVIVETLKTTEEDIRALWRVGFIYNLNTGERMLLTQNNIKMLIAVYPNLKSEFDDESYPNSEEVLLYYLERLNELK